ncbi:MAG: RibD family protein [bacterium]
MKRPKVIIHSSISLDGSLLGFEVDMQQHYHIAGSYKADIHLIGSNTIKAGIEMFCPKIPKEIKSDFVKPERDKNLPFWVIPDTKGKLKGLHHINRRFEFCKDIIVLVSKSTPKDYLSYLKERNYDYHIAGEKQVDYTQALELLVKQYNAKTILTDTGKILNCILLNKGLVDEISLLIHPVIVGKNQYTLFSEVNKNIKMELINTKTMGGNKTWLTYKVKKYN